jgi:2-keto-4-pentenoate hydratase/2-oxohepta-3-ene-1,7-dioic acid hydratase in catechol pathway
MRVGNLSSRLTLFTDQRAVDVEKASSGRFGADPQAVYDRWDEFTEWVARSPSIGGGVPFATEDLGAPAPRPGQVFAIGANYRAHAEEGGVEVPESPMVFTKWPSSFTGPVGDIVLAGETVDWEAELVAVIGKRARNVTAERGWEYIAGLTAGQDVSERTQQLKGGAYPQMGLGKSFPGFSPSGPWLVSLDEFADPGDLELSCTVNGQEMQKARTSDLVFPLPALVAELSRVVTLEPGDVIFTGTPGGVGLARKPPVFLAPGDELVTTVQGIGELRHRFVSA